MSSSVSGGVITDGCGRCVTTVRTRSTLPPLMTCGTIGSLSSLGINCVDSRPNSTTVLEVRLDSCNRLVIINDNSIYDVTRWAQYACTARDHHEQNVEAVRNPSTGAIFLRTTRRIESGEELYIWFEQSLAFECCIPVLTPTNIRNDGSYVCVQCGTVFHYPNPLKSHIRFHCSPASAATSEGASTQFLGGASAVAAIHPTGMTLGSTVPHWEYSASGHPYFNSAVVAAAATDRPRHHQLNHASMVAAPSVGCRLPASMQVQHQLAMRHWNDLLMPGKEAVDHLLDRQHHRQRQQDASQMSAAAAAAAATFASEWMSSYPEAHAINDILRLSTSAAAVMTASTRNSSLPVAAAAADYIYQMLTANYLRAAAAAAARSTPSLFPELVGSETKHLIDDDVTGTVTSATGDACDEDEKEEKNKPEDLSLSSHCSGSSSLASTAATTVDDVSSALHSRHVTSRMRRYRGGNRLPNILTERFPVIDGHSEKQLAVDAAAAAAAENDELMGHWVMTEEGGVRGSGIGGGYKCPYCNKLYSRKYGLKIHVRTHTGFKPLQCRVCRRPFGDPSNLNKHVRLHAAHLQSAVAAAAAAAAASSSVVSPTGTESDCVNRAPLSPRRGDSTSISHVDGGIPMTTSSPYSCRHCGKVLVRRRDLERHVRSRHPNHQVPEKHDDTPPTSKQDVKAVGAEPMADDGQPAVVTSSEYVSEDDA